LYIIASVKGKLRLASSLLATAACVYLLVTGVDWVVLFRATFQGVDAASLKDAVLQGIPQIIVCMSCIALGVLLIRRMRRRQRAQTNGKTSRSFNSDIRIAVSRITSALERCTALYAVVLTVFLALNLTSGIFRVKTAYEIRNAPNIIYIVVDTLRADHVGCYGYFRDTTPNIDRLASDGMRFSKAISQAPWTTASISSFMSSRYLRIMLTGERDSPPKNVVLMPEFLRDRGYLTAAVTSNPLAGKIRSLDRGYDYYSEYPELRNARGLQMRCPITAPEVLARTLDTIKRVKNRKFFLFVHFMDPHLPYVKHPGYNFYPSYKGRYSKDDAFGEIALPSGADDLKYVISLYDGEVAFTDHYIGRLLQELKKQKLYDDTLIVFLSDHGEEFNEHGATAHGTHLYDETISVPLIIKLPGQAAVHVVQGTFSLINLLPSITDYIKLDTSALGLQGTAVPLAGLRRVRETGIYSDTNFGPVQLESLRTETSKLIFNRATKDSRNVEFYDLKTDPGEKANIATTMQATMAASEAAMSHLDKEIDTALKHTINRSLTAQQQQDAAEALRSLGYLNR
jgi:arylsulfatase A-like enzyme